MSTSEALTRGVRVRVVSRYVPERSQPMRGEFFFAYTITIRNESPRTVQLLSRHWVITDAEGRTEEVRGPGVVGEQPVLANGQAFEYTSACPLPTPFGSMRGTYQMVDDAGQPFDVEIAPFRLSQPHGLN